MNVVLSGLRLPAGHIPFAVASGKGNRSNFFVHYLNKCADGRSNRSCKAEKLSNNPITSDDDESSKSSSLEEMLDLFKRIQSSISKRPKPKGVKKKKSSQSNESVLDDLRRPHITEDKETNTCASLTENKLQRPVSNFVKSSPIPSLASKMEEEIRGGSELQEIEKLKLPQLKQLAKSKGVKGYSNLKKGELIQLLFKHL